MELDGIEPPPFAALTDVALPLSYSSFKTMHNFEFVLSSH
jgi:hypothetical protein